MFRALDDNIGARGDRFVIQVQLRKGASGFAERPEVRGIVNQRNPRQHFFQIRGESFAVFGRVQKAVNVIENNLTDSPLQNDNNTSSPIKSEYNNTNNHIQNKFNYQKEKENENNDEARNLSTAYKTGNKINKENNLNNSNNSNFINVQNNNLNNEQRHNSIRSFDINIELNDEKIKRKTFGIAENERYSIPMNNSVINNNMRRSTVRISDCSEKITDASGERKVPLFEANFESEIHNVKVKPAERDKI